MHNLLRSTFVLVIYWLPLSAYTQTISTNIDNLVPPSPNVSALVKFGSIPVGLSTGIPRIEVPIYASDNNTFGQKLKISLDYHAGGVKVDEMASNVGQGWALNVGGVISRTVRGLYDEMPTYGFFDSPLPATIEEGNGPSGVQNSDRTLFRMYGGNMDSQNDLFSFNFNGTSGKFVFGKNSDILILSQQKLKIEKFIGIVASQPRINRLIITDEYGYKYEFSDCEVSQTAGGDEQNKFTSSWYLSRIINPAGTETERFEYQDTYFSYIFSLGASEALPLSGIGDLRYSFSSTPGQSVWGKRVKRIVIPDDKLVDFEYSTTARQDLPGDYLLSKITISKGVTRYGYNLSHSYMNNRPFLMSVTPFGGISEIPSRPYLFEYDSQYFAPRLSIQQDHWGFQNLNYGTLCPHEYIRAPGGSIPGFRELSGGNRDTDPSRVKAGSMVKMTYPTGGFTVFEMEANTAKNNWLEQNEKVTVSLPPYTDQSLVWGLNSANYPAAQLAINFNGLNNTATNFEIKVNPIGGECLGDCRITLEFYNPSNVLISTQVIRFSDSRPDPYQIVKTFTLFNLIKGGMYTIKAYTNDLSQYTNYMEINWREINAGGTSEIELSHVQPFVGGLRAKRILDYTENSANPAVVKEYEYVLEDGVTSSGSLGAIPKYSYQVYYDYKVDATLPQEPQYHGNFDYNYIIRSTSSVHDIAYTNGSPVSYSRVVEKSDQKGNYTGKTVRYFTSFADVEPIQQDVFPVVPTVFSSWFYGQLNKEELYNSSNQLIQKTENDYNCVVDNLSNDPVRVENFRSIAITPVKFLWSGNLQAPYVDPIGIPHYFLMSSFYPHAGRSELKQTVVTRYSSSALPIEAITDYIYDQQNYYLKEKVIFGSDQSITKTQLFYPQDMIDVASSNAATYQGMMNKNMINNLIEQKVLVNNVQISRTKNNYESQNGTFYAVKQVSSQGRENQAEEIRVRYLEYDNNGAPLSVQKEGGPLTNYIWGYGGQHLVAQIDNADYSVIKSILGEAALINFRNNKNPTDNDVEIFLAPLRNNEQLKTAMIQSFTYNSLLGLSSKTDSKNRKTSYEYDDFQRIVRIRDGDGKVVKEFTNHYR